MTRRILYVGLGVLGSLLALTVACAPATQSAPAQPSTSAPKKEEAATQPAPPKPAEQKPAPVAEKPAPPKEVAKPAAPDPGAKFGGILLVGGTADPISFASWQESGGAEPPAMLNSLLRWRDWGLELQCKDCNIIVGDLAKSWEWSKDGLSLTLRLEDGVLWHDGQPFTCADAAWSIDTIRTGKGLTRSPRALQFRSVVAVECPDALTAVLRLKRPQPSLISALAQGGYSPMKPKHLYENNIEKMKDKNSVPIASGPFIFQRYLPNEKITLTRNPKYWEEPYPYLDGVELLNLGKQSTAYAALRGGRIHVYGGAAYMSGKITDTLIKECTDCRVMYRSDVPSFMFLTVNHQRPPWNTPEVKAAISYAVDRNKFRQLALDGWSVPGGVLSCGGDGFWCPNNEPWFKEVPGMKFDDPEGNKAKARELLVKAGFRPGELAVKLGTTTGFFLESTVPLIEDLNAVGIRAEHWELERAVAYNVAGAGDFDLIGWSSGMAGRDPDLIFFDTYYTGADRNYGRYSNPEADRLMNAQGVIVEHEERRRVAFAAAKILMDDLSTIPLGWRMTQAVMGPDIRNWLPVYCGLCWGSRWDRVWLDRK